MTTDPFDTAELYTAALGMIRADTARKCLLLSWEQGACSPIEITAYATRFVGDGMRSQVEVGRRTYTPCQVCGGHDDVHLCDTCDKPSCVEHNRYNHEHGVWSCDTCLRASGWHVGTWTASANAAAELPREQP